MQTRIGWDVLFFLPLSQESSQWKLFISSMLCWLVSWSSVISGGKCLWNLRCIWCHSQVFQSSASWWFQRSHIEGLKIAESPSPDERCLKGGYQDWGTQSKHLTHMHTSALRVFGSDKNWQCAMTTSVFVSYWAAVFTNLQHPPLTTWAKDLSVSQSENFLCLNQDTGDNVL